MELYCNRIGVRGGNESEAVSRAEDWRCYGGEGVAERRARAFVTRSNISFNNSLKQLQNITTV